MQTIDIAQAARILRPGTAWNVSEKQREDGSIEAILQQAEDGTLRVTPPTIEDCQKIVDQFAYIDKRKNEYPSVGDQLDALWKGGQHADEMLTKVISVKEKYPKPNA